ncbi:MAG: alpha-amylase family glycosyl hydrolase [bacterium]|nr:alpha-amylase family glycosyl hydrolase [bacterium]
MRRGVLLLGWILGGVGVALGAPLTAANQLWNIRTNWPRSYYPSKTDWRSTVCFQLMTDRWYDGCPTNNELAYGGYDVTDRSLRHGGDFEGIRRKVEYLKGFGVDMIWISPIFQNKYNEYHGYGQIDRTLLDKRWGTVIDMRRMTDALHARGVLLCIDEVSNHGGNLLYGSNLLGDWPKFHMHTDEYTLHYANTNEVHADYVVSNVYSATGNYGCNFDSGGNPVCDTGSGGFFADDFHHNGECSFDSSWQQWLGEFPGVGYDDFATERGSCIARHIDTFTNLLAHDIDAIREDTPMEMLVYYFQQWCPASRVFARDALGKSNFFMFGEYFTSFEYAKKMTGRNANGVDFCLNAGVDYRSYFDFFRPAVFEQQNGYLGKLKQTYDAYSSYDFTDWRDGERKYTMLTFYNNHDQPRLSTWPDGDAKTRLASGIILTWPGIPCLYHGDEQGFKTTFDGDKNVREDYMVSAAYVVDGGVTNRARGDNFNMCHENYRWIAKIANYRRLYPALWQTDELRERWHQSYYQNGIYAFTRIWGHPTNWVLVVFNTWSGTLSYGPMYTEWTNTTVVNLMNTSETATTDGSGRMSGSCVGYGLQLWVPQSNVRALAPVVESVSPAHDAWVASPTSIQLTFSKPMAWGALTGAFRVNGQPVAASTLSLGSGNKVLTYTPSPALGEGIHWISISTAAYDTTDSLPLFAEFSTRLRIGSVTNPVINYDLKTDPTLINDGGSYSGAVVTLYHKAVGAEWFRCKNEGGTWSAWMPYTNVSSWTLSGVGGTRRVWVQYWADGSAAFIIYDDVAEAGTLTANFTGTPLSGTNPLRVVFTDLSTTATVPIISWQWDFGDGNTSNLRHPTNVYRQTGMYTVRLIVSDGYNVATNRKERYVAVYEPRAGDDIESSVYTDDMFVGKNGGYGFGAWQACTVTDGGTWREIGGNKISGARSMGTWGNPGNYAIRRSFATALTNAARFTFKWRPRATLNAGHRIAVILRNGDSNQHWVGQRLALFFEDVSGTDILRFYDGVDKNTSVSYQYGHVYAVEIIVDPTNNTYAFTVRDEDSPSNAVSTNGTLITSGGLAGTPINSFALYLQLGSTDHDSIWDEFLVTTASNTLVASFVAVPTNGPAPLSVQFTDASLGGPTAWAWDVDNNGSVDATVQHPAWTYQTAGVYSVRLTVSNGANAATLVKPGYIVVSAPTAPAAPAFYAPTAYAHRVDVAWQRNASNDPVLIVRNTSGVFGTPTNGTWYSAGQSALGGYVVFAGAGTFVRDTNLAPQVQYYYVAWSVNAQTNYSLSYAATNATTLAFGAPSSLQAVAHSGAIDLTWQKNSAGHGVLIVRSLSGAFYEPSDFATYAVGQNALGGVVVYKGSGTSFRDDNLNYEQTYYYKAWSCDDEYVGPYYSSGTTVNKTTGEGLPEYLEVTFDNAAEGELFAVVMSGGVWYVSGGSYWWTNGAAPAAGAVVLVDGVRNPVYRGVEFSARLKPYAASPFQRAGLVGHYRVSGAGVRQCYLLTITNATNVRLAMTRYENGGEVELVSTDTGAAFDTNATYILTLRFPGDNSFVGSLQTNGGIVVAQVLGSDTNYPTGLVGLYAGYGSGAEFLYFMTQAPEPVFGWLVVMLWVVRRR